MLTPSQLERRKNRTIRCFGDRTVYPIDIEVNEYTRFEKDAMYILLTNAGWHATTMKMRGFKIDTSRFKPGITFRENIIKQAERWFNHMQLERSDIVEPKDEKQLTLI